MIPKNLKQWFRLRWNLLNIFARYDVLFERAVTIKYWRSIKFGRKCTLQSSVYLYGSRSGKKVCIGNDVVISSACMLLGEGGITIGDFTHLGPLVVVTTQYGDSAGEMRTSDPHLKYAPVRIGKGCWIGASAVVMPGTTLGDCCIVAPGSVVYGVWGDHVTLMGSPARRQKQ